VRSHGHPRPDTTKPRRSVTDGADSLDGKCHRTQDGGYRLKMQVASPGRRRPRTSRACCRPPRRRWRARGACA